MAEFTRDTLAAIDKLMLELIDLQHKKVLDLANKIHPGLSSEDIRNPHDFPTSSPIGIELRRRHSVGIQKRHMALRAKIANRYRGRRIAF